MSAEVTHEDVKSYELANRGAALVLSARSFVIDSSATCQKAGEFVKSIADLKKEIEETFNPICEAANKAHKTATAKRAEHLAQPQEADGIMRQKIGAFLAEEKRREAAAAAEEQRRLQAEADDLALAEAQQLEAAGMPELAEAVISTPPVVAPVPVQRTQMAGVAAVETWGYSELPEVSTSQSCDGEAALIEKAIAALDALAYQDLRAKLKGLATVIRTRTKRFYLTKDTKKIGGVVRALKKDADQEVRGIKCYPSTNLRVGGRR